MRNPWLIVLAAAGGFAGAVAVATVASGQSKAQLPANRRVALIGDSYAVGLGPELARLLPNFQFEGHVGTNTSQWANHVAGYDAWLPNYQPFVTLVSLGVNDGNAPNIANYQAIVSWLHGIGSRVIWIEPPAGFNAPAVRRVIAALGIRTVPATQTPLSADGLHPVSYAPWTREVAAIVSSELASP